MKKLSPEVVATLVEARQQAHGHATGKGAFDAFRLGLVEQTERGYELNMRGQDIADEAIALAKPVRRR